MADDASVQGSGGVTVKIPGTKTEISASDTSVISIERAYERTLQWADQDKAEFFTVCALVALTIVLRFLRKKNADRMRQDYQRTRDNARQPRLPHIDELPPKGRKSPKR